MTIVDVKSYSELYIDGNWSPSLGGQISEIINPATEEPCARVPRANTDDVNLAVMAARRAYSSWSQTSAATRAGLIQAIADEMEARKDDLAEVISLTMGCPRHIAVNIHVAGPIRGMRSFCDRAFAMEAHEKKDGFLIIREPIGVCAFVNPWNYPLHQLVGKLAPALAAGCTIVAKPAEQTPLQDFIMAEIFHKVSLPAGVFNLVSGSGSQIGPLLASHEQVDMVSFTGSTAVGIGIAQAAAPTVKRVCQELGGKSPFIITEGADLQAAVRYGVEDVMINSGQACNALTRMLVPRSRHEEAVEIARRVAEEQKMGDPNDETVTMGPVSSSAQKRSILEHIENGIAEGARLVTGGTGMPSGLEKGAYVLPTIFADVSNDMVIAREEIFGPVLCMLQYENIDNAVEIANDTVYGLSSAVYAEDLDSALAIARRLRSGQCFVQGAFFNYDAPFGGYKQSGNGREWGYVGLAEFTETKAILFLP